MQIVFDLSGKCAPYGKPCVHYDGEYRGDSPCGGCERNPKIAELRDRYKSLNQAAKDIENAPLPAVPPTPGAPIDRLTQLEQDNASEMRDWGLTRPAGGSKRPK